MKNVVCFNCGHTEYHGGDGCTRMLENGNYCWCAVEGPGVIMAHEIRVDQRAKAFEHLKALGKVAKKDRPDGEYLMQAVVPIFHAIAAYRAIGVLPVPKERK